MAGGTQGGGQQQQLAQALQPQGAPAGGSAGGMSPFGQMGGGGKSGGAAQGQGWSPAFQGQPAPAGVTAQYPQLQGGYYNQMTQMAAGPSYSMAGAPKSALPTPAAARPGVQLPTPQPGTAGGSTALPGSLWSQIKQGIAQ